MKANQKVVENWRSIVSAFECSRMSRSGFCQQNRIKTCQLDYWRKRFRSSNRNGQALTEGWIPLQIQNDQSYEGHLGSVCLLVEWRSI